MRIEKHFAAIGAQLVVRPGPIDVDYRFDVIRHRRSEYFELRGSRIWWCRVRHNDHATIHLRGWHRVYLNGEYWNGRVTFYD